MDSPAAPAAGRPGRVLRWASHLLPPERRDWADAMRAELMSIDSASERRRFTAGCLRAIMARPTTLRVLGGPLTVVAALVAVVRLTSRTAYAPMHWGLVLMAAVLSAWPLLGRRRGLLGPVGTGWAPRLVRAGGLVLVAAMTLTVVLGFRAGGGDVVSRTSTGLPVFTSLLSAYTIGFLAATARPRTGDGRLLAASAGIGIAGAGGWFAWAAVAPPIPASILWAVLTIAAVMGLSAWLGAARGAAALGALCAGTVTSLLVVVLVNVLIPFGSARWVPAVVPQALTPADRLSNSRIEAPDPYLSVLLLGALMALALVVTSSTRKELGSPVVEGT